MAFSTFLETDDEGVSVITQTLPTAVVAMSTGAVMFQTFDAGGLLL